MPSISGQADILIIDYSSERFLDTQCAVKSVLWPLNLPGNLVRMGSADQYAVNVGLLKRDDTYGNFIELHRWVLSPQRVVILDDDHTC